MSGTARSYLRKVFREAFGLDHPTVVREGGGHSCEVKVEARGQQVHFALEGDGLKLWADLEPETAWLLGGKLMDVATEIARGDAK
jgi:hypothetical protein